MSNYGGYNMAVAASRGYAGGKAAVHMIAGAAHQGAVDDPHTLTRFEHRVSSAKLLRAQHTYSEYDVNTNMEVIEYKSDATHTYAIDKAKGYLNAITLFCGQHRRGNNFVRIRA